MTLSAGGSPPSSLVLDIQPMLHINLWTHSSITQMCLVTWSRLKFQSPCDMCHIPFFSMAKLSAKKHARKRTATQVEFISKRGRHGSKLVPISVVPESSSSPPKTSPKKSGFSPHPQQFRPSDRKQPFLIHKPKRKPGKVCSLLHCFSPFTTQSPRPKTTSSESGYHFEKRICVTYWTLRPLHLP
jgi:hypothetical protein